MLNVKAFLILPAVHVLLINQIDARVPIANNEVMSFADVREPQTRSPNNDPGHIDVHITAFGETRSLKLVPREEVVFSADFRGFVSDVDENGRNVIKEIVTSRRVHEDINSKLYTDSTGSASLYVERRNGHITLDGVLDHETRIGNDNDRQGRSLDEPANHVVYKRMVNPDGDTCLAIVPNVTLEGPKRLKGTNVVLPSQVYPEVHLVLDYETAKFHNFNFDSMMKYIGIFFYSVNRRYAPITSPKIYHIVTGITYAVNANTAQPYVKYGTGSIVDGYSTIPEFGRWIYANRNTLLKNSADLIVWMSGLDMASKQNDTWITGLAGLAYLGTACISDVDSQMNLNVGITEDKPGSYNGIHTVAHEMGHTLGAAHDGSKVDFPPGNPGAEACPWDDGYIMAYPYGTINKFYFSTCSINQFKYVLGQSYGSCLLNAPQKSAAKCNATLPGTIKSLDEQCQAQFGSDFAFSETRLNIVCVVMACRPKSGVGGEYAHGPAQEGSRCGDNKICIYGECVNK